MPPREHTSARPGLNTPPHFHSSATAVQLHLQPFMRRCPWLTRQFDSTPPPLPFAARDSVICPPHQLLHCTLRNVPSSCLRTIFPRTRTSAPQWRTSRMRMRASKQAVHPIMVCWRETLLSPGRADLRWFHKLPLHERISQE